MNVYEVEFENLYEGEKVKNILAKDLAEATEIALKILAAARENFSDSSEIIRIEFLARIDEPSKVIEDMVRWNKDAQEQFKDEESEK